MSQTATTALSCRWHWRNPLAQLRRPKRISVTTYFCMSLRALPIALVCLCAFSLGADRHDRALVGFALRSPAFDKFVADSYKVNGGDPREFYRWFDESFKRVSGSNIDEYVS